MYDIIAEEHDFGRYIDVFILASHWDGGPRHVLHFDSIREGADDERYVLLKETSLVEGVKPRPSLSIPSHLVGPLVDALTNHTPTKIDQTVLDTVKVERERVDKMLDFMIARLSPTVVFQGPPRE